MNRCRSLFRAPSLSHDALFLQLSVGSLGAQHPDLFLPDGARLREIQRRVTVPGSWPDASQAGKEI